MNSSERRQSRYERRKAERAAKKEAFLKQYNQFSRLTDVDNLYAAYRDCALGVGWKGSTQRYASKWAVQIQEARRKLLAGEDVRSGFVEFTLRERGKERHIRSVHISERVIQKVLCDQVLTPLLSRSLIYDNSASLKNKGTSFALRRLITHLSRYYRRYGNTGYVLTVDYSGFFDSIDHDILIGEMKKYITDRRVLRLTTDFIYSFGGGKSLGLGSQVSQNAAIFFPSRAVDHLCKDELGIKGYGRYMDDLYLIHPDKEYLRYCLRRIIEASERIGLRVNGKKTRITTVREGFIFLKGRYSLTETGRIRRLPLRSATVRTRKRLAKHAALVRRGVLSYRDVHAAYESWRGTFRRRFQAFYRLGKMDAYYNQLFFKEEQHDKKIV
jgi:hypothetical protein